MRGLESLIPQKKTAFTDGATEKESVFMIDIDKIKPNPYQPRREFDERELKSLADSIRVYGILQPLLVSKVEKDVPTGRDVEYELIAGERRLRAAKLAHLPRVPVVVRQGASNTQKLEVALIENIQRHDLNAIDEARAFKQLKDEFAMTYTEIGKRVSKSQPYIMNTVRILALPESMQDALVRGEINEGHTRPLLSLKRFPDRQQKLFDAIVKQKFTVRQAEAMGREMLGGDASPAQMFGGGRSVIDEEVVQMLEQFKNTHGLSRVNANTSGRTARLAITFSSKTDLKEWVQKFIQS